MPLKTLLVDDHAIVRYGLKAALAGHPSIQIVGEAGNGLDACKMVEQMLPDLVIMDISMPTMNGTEATRSIKKSNPHIKIIILSMYDRREFVLDILAAGANGYILKTNTVDELPLAIDAVMADDIYLSPKIATLVTKECIELAGTTPKNQKSTLTARERQILQFLAEGHSSKAIAMQLQLGETTVVTHRQSIMNKTGLRTVAELTKYAIQNGITSLETI